MICIRTLKTLYHLYMFVQVQDEYALLKKHAFLYFPVLTN